MNLTRAAQFDTVIVRLKPTAANQTWLLTVESTSGVNIHDLTRPYADPKTALNAYRGMCTLFAAGWPVAAVIDFAQQHAAQPTAEYERTACEKAA
jgi:hypothetical protein